MNRSRLRAAQSEDQKDKLEINHSVNLLLAGFSANLMQYFSVYRTKVT